MKNKPLNFKKNINYFICPICKTNFTLNKNSYICKNKHCYDISSKNYINFYNKKNKTKYNKELFYYRKTIYEYGFFKKLEDSILKEIEKYKKINIFDAGCGEGYFSNLLLINKNINQNINIFATDISKEAILSSKQKNKVNFFVSNLCNIPLKDKCIDLILNILSPCDYKEFLRILKKDGLVLKVIATKNYLKEIREEFKIKQKGTETNEIIKLFKKNIKIIDIKNISYQILTTPEQFIYFLKMSPLSFNVNEEKIKIFLNNNTEKNISIDLQLLIGKNQT